MAQTKEGAAIIAAKKIGISLDGYKVNIKNGFLWCTGCKKWHKADGFNRDKSRWSGHAQSCRNYLKIEYKKRYKPIPLEKRKSMGPDPAGERHGDKLQARHRVNVLVKAGKIPRPNDLPCTDCGHIYKEDSQRHEYDHHLGYDIGNHLVVIPVCSKCHHKRHPIDYSKRGKKCKKPKLNT